MSKIKITLKKSKIACLENQKANLKALGLTKIGQSKIHDDNAVIRGMITKVNHLVQVEEVKN